MSWLAPKRTDFHISEHNDGFVVWGGGLNTPWGEHGRFSDAADQWRHLACRCGWRFGASMGHSLTCPLLERVRR